MVEKELIFQGWENVIETMGTHHYCVHNWLGRSRIILQNKTFFSFKKPNILKNFFLKKPFLFKLFKSFKGNIFLDWHMHIGVAARLTTISGTTYFSCSLWSHWDAKADVSIAWRFCTALQSDCLMCICRLKHFIISMCLSKPKYFCCDIWMLHFTDDL